MLCLFFENWKCANVSHALRTFFFPPFFAHVHSPQWDIQLPSWIPFRLSYETFYSIILVHASSERASNFSIFIHSPCKQYPRNYFQLLQRELVVPLEIDAKHFEVALARRN